MASIPRRAILAAPWLAAACRRAPQQAAGWTPDLDRILIRKAVAARDQRFDPAYNMLRVLLGPEYRYHTRLRECQAHPTRESLEYALYLLEEGSPERFVRAQRILERVVPLQVADPASKWYGLWGWYLEEPPDRMAPADFNWADFNGALLLLVELRHGRRLPESLRKRVREAIGHAARSVMRRDAPMSYTHVAILGTFVTLAAGELLEDAELLAYARQRLVRLCREIDRTGSFAEYNAPPYVRVSLVNLARIRMYVKDAEARQRAARIERRLWEHLAAHWDAVRLQFCGPMSRCHSTDLGYPLWLEKALRGRLRLATPDNRTGDDDGETAIHDLRCPEDLLPRFLEPRTAFEHREWYIAEPPVCGTAYMCRGFSLGSANRSDFWVQRRPLLGYFGDASRPARTVRLRVIKDGYDFASAVFHSVQERGRVLGLIAFRDPGGDRHITLDPIRGGRFECGRLFAELHISGLPEGYSHTVQLGRLEVDSSSLRLAYRLAGGRFGERELRLAVHPHPGDFTATIDFKPPDAPRQVVWSQIRTAFAAIALELAEAGEPLSPDAPSVRLQGDVAELIWGPLWLRGLVRPAPAEEHERAFEARIGGQAVPLPRLSHEPLA